MEQNENLKVEFTNLTQNQKDALILLFKRMYEDGNYGHSETIGFFSDGDGNFRPKIKIDNVEAKDTTISYISNNEMEALKRICHFNHNPIKCGFFIDQDIMNGFQNCNEMSKTDISDNFVGKIWWKNSKSEYEIGDIQHLSGDWTALAPGYKNYKDIPPEFFNCNKNE